MVQLSRLGQFHIVYRNHSRIIIHLTYLFVDDPYLPVNMNMEPRFRN